MAISLTHVGTTSSKSSPGTLSVTVGAAGVPAGSCVFVCAGMNCPTDSGAIGNADDTPHNTYQNPASLRNARNQQTATGTSYSYNLVTALVQNNTISIGLPITNACAVSVFYATGLATSADPLDTTTVALNMGSSAGAQTVTMAAAPAVANSLVIGLIAYRGVPSAFSQDATNAAYGTPPNVVGTTGNPGSSNSSIGGGSIVSSLQLTYVPGEAAAWGMAIAAFKPPTGTTAQGQAELTVATAVVADAVVSKRAGSATLPAATSIDARGLATEFGQLTSSAVAGETAVGFLIPSIAGATLVAVASVSPDGVRVTPAVNISAAEGNISFGALSKSLGNSIEVSAASVTADTYSNVSAAASTDAVSSLVTDAFVSTASVAQLSSDSSLVINEQIIQPAISEFDATADISADGDRAVTVIDGEAELDATTSIVADGQRIVDGAGTLPGDTATDAAGSVIRETAAVLTADANESAAGIEDQPAASDITADTTVVVDGERIVDGAGTLAGETSTDLIGFDIQSAALAAAGDTSVISDGQRVVDASNIIDGETETSLVGIENQLAVSASSIDVSVSADTESTSVGAALLSASVNISASADQVGVAIGEAELECLSILIADAAVQYAASMVSGSIAEISAVADQIINVSAIGQVETQTETLANEIAQGQAELPAASDIVTDAEKIGVADGQATLISIADIDVDVTVGSVSAANITSVSDVSVFEKQNNLATARLDATTDTAAVSANVVSVATILPGGTELDADTQHGFAATVLLSSVSDVSIAGSEIESASSELVASAQIVADGDRVSVPEGNFATLAANSNLSASALVRERAQFINPSIAALDASAQPQLRGAAEISATTESVIAVTAFVSPSVELSAATSVRSNATPVTLQVEVSATTDVVADAERQVFAQASIEATTDIIGGSNIEISESVVIDAASAFSSIPSIELFGVATIFGESALAVSLIKGYRAYRVLRGESDTPINLNGSKQGDRISLTAKRKYNVDLDGIILDEAS